jgi:serine/threonine-protein kinase
VTEQADTLVGTTLAGNYILDRVLGEGGMGRVYEARHTRIAAKRFAIKVLHQEYAQHQEALDRFKREAEAAALISHPNVVGVHDYGRTPDGRPYLVSDFLEGEELADRLQRVGTLPVGEAVRIVRQVCNGLAVAHANGVTHRDIKPENVFLVGADEDLTAKVIDFGISRFVDNRGKSITKAGIALGTPDFMSPEQAKGKKVDHRADIYGVGVMLYVMLTGVMPFERESPQDTLLALLTEEAPPPRMLEESIPEGLEMIIQKAMAKEADDRYQWIAQLNQALAPYDPGSGQLSTTPDPGLVQPAQASQQPAATAPAALPTQDASDARSARGWIVGALALAMPATFIVLLLAVGGVLAVAGVDLDAVTWLVAFIVLLAGLGPPYVLSIRHVIKDVWSNRARAVELSRRLRPTLVAGGGTYALAAMIRRLLDVTVLEATGEPTLGDGLLALLALGAALIAFLTSRQRA